MTSSNAPYREMSHAVDVHDLVLHSDVEDASPLINKLSTNDHEAKHGSSTRYRAIALCCCMILIGLVVVVYAFFDIDLLRRINHDLHTISSAINPTYLNGGRLWNESCTAVSNASSLMHDRCTCLSPSDMLSRRTTCLVQPDVLLKEYYQPVVDYYPEQLTYRPQIDCNHGRYLIIDRFLEDGLGMGIGSHDALLSMAAYHHLQLIEVPWTSTHIEPYHTYQSAQQVRRLHYGAFEWEVPRAQWLGCPDDSAVHRNELTFDNWDLNKGLDWRRLEMTRYNTSILPFLQSHQNEGLTIRFKYWNGHSACMHPTSLIHSVRNAVDPDRIFQRFPFFDDYLDHPYIEVHVHLRRGDLGRWNETLGEWEAGLHRYRVITTATWQSLFTQILAALPWSVVQRLRWTIYTEGDHNVIDPILDTIRQGQLASFTRALSPGVAVTYNEPPVRYVPDDMDAMDSMTSYSQGDILITSPSEFSAASCVINPFGLRIGLWFGGKWHGCLNDFQIHRTTWEYPPEWRNSQWVPESVLTASNKITISNTTELLLRVQDQIARVDKRRRDGLYPHDQQKPDFISPHRSHLMEQLQRDVELGFVTPEDERYINLMKYVASYDDGKVYDRHYFRMW